MAGIMKTAKDPKNIAISKARLADGTFGAMLERLASSGQTDTIACIVDNVYHRATGTDIDVFYTYTDRNWFPSQLYHDFA